MPHLNTDDIVLIRVEIGPPAEYVTTHLVFADAAGVILQDPSSQVKENIPELRSLHEALAGDDTLG
jgi:hypothetical protein